MAENDKYWLNSAEVRKVLRISTCELAHLRVEGAIRAERRGNAYYYVGEDVAAFRASRQKKGVANGRSDDK